MAMDLEKMLKMSASELSTWLETKAVQLMYCDIFEGKLKHRYYTRRSV